MNDISLARLNSQRRARMLFLCTPEFDDDDDDADWDDDDDGDAAPSSYQRWSSRPGFASPEWWSGF